MAVLVGKRASSDPILKLDPIEGGGHSVDVWDTAFQLRGG
jgi:hypothetical protein